MTKPEPIYPSPMRNARTKEPRMSLVTVLVIILIVLLIVAVASRL